MARDRHDRPGSGLACVLLLAGCAAAGPPGEPATVRAEFEHAAMGTLFRVSMFAADGERAEAAARAAFERIDAIERVATDYDARSEARRLSESAVRAWVPVSDDLALVLRASDQAARTSGGAFDPTVGPLIRLWRRALRDREWPSQSRWDAAAARTGWELVALEERSGVLHVRLDGDVRLDFGAIAKGVAVDEALRAIEASGVLCALVDGGGDLAALPTPPPDRPGWRVRVEPTGDDGPSLRIWLAGAAVATSGDRYASGHVTGTPLAGVEDADAVFGHVIDPRTRRPLPTPRAAVMTAATAAEADALATARLVLGPERSDVDALERGLYIGSRGQAPCVGARFPHDGVLVHDADLEALTPPVTPSAETSPGLLPQRPDE